MLRDIESPRWLYTKAFLLLLLCVGLLASTILLLQSPTLQTAALLATAIWGFCRAYYFAFYVIEHYADPHFKFAGLISFLRYQRTRPYSTPPPASIPIISPTPPTFHRGDRFVSW